MPVIQPGGGSSSLTIGTTPITGGTLNDALSVGAGGVLQNTAVNSGSGSNTIVVRDSNGKASSTNFIEGFTVVNAAGGTTAMTAASTHTQFLSGTGNQSFTLPDATTLTAGEGFLFINSATGTLTVENHGGSVLGTVVSGGTLSIELTTNVSANGTWISTNNNSQLGGIGPGYITGELYGRPTNAALVNASLAINTLYATPIYIGSQQTFTKINIFVDSAGVGGFADLGIYANNGNGAPGALVLDFGQISVGTTGNKIATSSVSLAPGWYWLVIWNGGATCQMTGAATTDTGLYPFFPLFNTGTGPFAGYSAGSTYSTGNMPNPFPASPTALYGAAVPIAWIEA